MDQVARAAFITAQSACLHATLVAMQEQNTAERAAAKATARGTPMTHYRGRCGHLHVARVRRKNGR